MNQTNNRPLLKISTCFFSLFSFFITAQTSFFKSDIPIKNNQPDNLISSFTIDQNQVYFNGSNYTLYVFDKNNTHLKFEKPLQYRSNISPYIVHDKILVGAYIGDNRKTLLLNKSKGLTEQTLNLPPSFTTLFQKNNTLYGTVVEYDGGEFFAYDLQNNKGLWTKFISRGINRHPLYTNNYITLSIGDENWTDVNNDGTLKDTSCEPDIFARMLKAMEHAATFCPKKKETF